MLARYSFEMLLITLYLLLCFFALKALYNALKELLFLSFLEAASIGWIKPVDQLVDKSRLLHFSFDVLFVVPVLVIVKIWPVFTKSRFLNNFIGSELVSKLTWLIVGIEPAIVHMNVTVAPRTICLSSRYMLSSTKVKTHS